MNIDRAIAIVKAKGKRIPAAPRGQPETATLWNVASGEVIREGVYFAYSAGLMKIGYAGIPRRRLITLTASAAMPVTMVLIVPGGEKDERKFHARFAEERVHHEWFQFSKRMRDFLRARLCPTGRESLKKAQADFAAYCNEVRSTNDER